MPEQPADPLHYEMKIPPEKPTSDSEKDSDQQRAEDRQPDAQVSQNKDAGADDDKPETRRP